MRKCKKCLRTMGSDQLRTILNRKKDGYYNSSYCRACEREYQLNYKKKKAQPNIPLSLPPDHPFIEGRECNECREFKSAENFSISRDGRSFKGIAMNSKCKPCKEIQKSKAFIRRRYGISYEEYVQIREDQDHKCAICRSSDHKNKRTGQLLQTFFIDHDHATGNVRGLLCSSCNHALGQFKDDRAVMLNAIAYLTN
ncbi:endonuclease VII domain-containing protein [Planktomarina temperata]|nr:endonuclease VII domain-containing protein [Planktomarina temperata]